MNVHLLSEAVGQISLMTDTRLRQTGFLLGDVIGKHALIQSLFPQPFNRRTIAALYDRFYRQYGHRLRGVFFCHTAPFSHEWFRDDVILSISGRGIHAYSYQSEGPKMTKKHHRLEGIRRNHDGINGR